MAKKYYAVLEGRGTLPFIYDSWMKCQPQVSGIRAKYQGFDTVDSAINYILSNSQNKKGAAQKLHDQGFSIDLEGIVESLPENVSLIASVSAKYDPGSGIARYTVTIKKEGKKVAEFSHAIDNPAMRHIDAELAGTRKAVEYALSNKETAIKVLNKYEGVSMWAKGERQAKNPQVRNYIQFISTNSGKVSIVFGKL